MIVTKILPVLAAVGSAVAQSSCKATTTTVASQAEATKIASCKKFEGSVVVTGDGGIDLSGPSEITGDLKVFNISNLDYITSSTLRKVGGKFTLQALEKLNRVEFPSLTEVGSLTFQALPALDAVTLGPLSKADEVAISDTFTSRVDMINVTTIRSLDINNNKRLTSFVSALQTVTGALKISANGIGLGLEVELPNLIWANELAIANVTTFDVPSLRVVNGSARFDSNFFESFIAPNLTHTEKGDISFVGNGALTNLSFPVLTELGGGLLIANNTELEEIDAFPKLRKVGGAVKLRGSFKDVDFPSLEVVLGAFDVSSTEDIRKVCDKLKELAPAHQGGNGKVEGTFTCTSDNAAANEDTGAGSTGDGQIDGSDDESSAAGVVFNTALFGLVAVAAVASAL
ncbi:putative cell wall protein [Thermochaetoides thermophila DSM 1495]|uniref:Putative cell wall protein n=1 Tax=Chaetomium thermophilum (strain DSM 1495 / CBS 144.50 / IMI 039719) TaxID=759272 RepID=G0SEF6_CHATD|nr:putative cell wall protein [Thermochaetoides thermophila DSM 1495]EGS18333.1 putative cell wall protein [Thermochaetoides thermophila DSM 1495]